MKERTTIRIVIPGINVSQGASKMKVFPLERILPQVAWGGGTPNPKKLKPASVKMAVAIPMVADTSTGAMALGIMCRNMIRRFPMPRALAAVTKSCSRNERNSARTKRVAPIQLVRPITIIML